MVSRTHVVVDSNGTDVVHMHENILGKYGGICQFPDEWTGTPTVNAPYAKYSSNIRTRQGTRWSLLKGTSMVSDERELIWKVLLPYVVQGRIGEARKEDQLASDASFAISDNVWQLLDEFIKTENEQALVKAIRSTPGG